jgi:GNAT superfamily N-acetyltransferase
MTSVGEEIVYEAFEPTHGEAVAAFSRELDWPSYTDPANARRALQAPGALTWVARCDGAVVGLAHLLTDGMVQAHLSLVGVVPAFRRRGIARVLIQRVFERSGAKWLDLAAAAGSEPFYRSFLFQECTGFRIYPNAEATGPLESTTE